MFCIIQRLWKTSKTVFQSVINTWKESWCSKILQRSLKNAKFGFEISMKTFFFIKIFLILYWNVNTFRIIYKTWKAFVVLSQAVNDILFLFQAMKDIWKASHSYYKNWMQFSLDIVYTSNWKLFELVHFLNCGNPAQMFIHNIKIKLWHLL